MGWIHTVDLGTHTRDTVHEQNLLRVMQTLSQLQRSNIGKDNNNVSSNRGSSSGSGGGSSLGVFGVAATPGSAMGTPLTTPIATPSRAPHGDDRNKRKYGEEGGRQVPPRRRPRR